MLTHVSRYSSHFVSSVVILPWTLELIMSENNPDFVLNNNKPLNSLFKTPNKNGAAAGKFGAAAAKFSVAGPNAQANAAKKAAVPKKKDIWGIEQNPNALNTKVRKTKIISLKLFRL